ncbi:replication initiator protein [Blackfly microvirus SF02]|uniref:Replication initiator protein n=1 Tax=Blackfly microvirus SF02 TaxID=2576452 RepID=A0A4P8PKC3_9VIRU|nr:replication initiator protein [Blackfly microvirus SF02]
MHERQCHDSAVFVTLTYDDEHVPYGGVLHYRHFQLFMKKLRFRLSIPVRFFMCGEYGDTTWRPHYHAALFGVSFGDRQPWRKSGAGFQLYRSELLDSLWDFGSAEIGELSFESAAYIARYCMKKITGDRATAHYERLLPDTGEIIGLPPEFARMSLKPGIGAEWFRRFAPEVLTHNGCVVDGRVLNVPRFYQKMMSDDDLHDFTMQRYNLLEGGTDNSYDRLRVRELVARAGLANKIRPLE